MIDPLSEYVLVANTAADASAGAWSVFALHIASSAKGVRFDCYAEFAVLYPVISCSVRREAGDVPQDRQPEMHLYTMQARPSSPDFSSPSHCLFGPRPHYAQGYARP